MTSRCGAILFFLTTIIGTLALLTGCEREYLLPTEKDGSAPTVTRPKSDSTSVPPRDTIRKDTTIIVLPPDTCHIPADTIRKDTLDPRPKPFPVDTLVPQPPKDSIRTDTVKRKH